MPVHITLGLYVKQHPHSSRMRKRKARKLKPGKPSRANELWYKAQLLQIVKLLRKATQDDLIPLFKQMQQSFGDAVPLSIKSALQTAAKKFGNIDGVAKRLTKEAVTRNLAKTDKQLVQHVKSAVGVNIAPALTNDGIRIALQTATTANIDLITSIPTEYFSKVEALLDKNWTTGTRWEELADMLEHVGDVTESRAKLIARDQTSKMNGAFNQARQTSIGIEQYEWQTAGDERVRETHAAHDGVTFDWDSPPEDTGNPGEDINCRCVAIPVFDLDDDEEDTE